MWIKRMLHIQLWQSSQARPIQGGHTHEFIILKKGKRRSVSLVASILHNQLETTQSCSSSLQESPGSKRGMCATFGVLHPCVQMQLMAKLLDRRIGTYGQKCVAHAIISSLKTVVHKCLICIKVKQSSHTIQTMKAVKLLQPNRIRDRSKLINYNHIE